MHRVTRITKLHKASILTIGRKIFNANDVSLLEKALQECSREYSRIIVANDNATDVLGFAIVKQRVSTVNTYELAFLGIDPIYQGRGGGSQLLRAIEDALPPSASCWLLVNQDNPTAQNVYSKFGFHILCESLDPFQVPCFIMMKIPCIDIPPHIKPLKLQYNFNSQIVM